MITPTIGRIVWFRPNNESHKATMNIVDSIQPLKADIVYVWNDQMVNLFVVDHAGIGHSLGSIHLVQDGDPPMRDGISYAEWMPYQKGQAAKYEQLEKEKSNA
jgi:hypothetical protein